jgi:hypothetical protein
MSLGGCPPLPDFVRRQIEAMYPGLPKIELIARGRIPGWAVWEMEAETSRAGGRATRKKGAG